MAGCSQTRSQPETADATPDAAQRASPGKALVYVLRDERFASGRMLAVELADHDATDLPAGASQRWDVAPGDYLMRVSGDTDSEGLKLDLAAGDRVFVRASVTVTDDGVGGRLTRLPEERGERAVTRTRLLASD
jgi:hypothetical protein